MFAWESWETVGSTDIDTIFNYIKTNNTRCILPLKFGSIFLIFLKNYLDKNLVLSR